MTNLNFDNIDAAADFFWGVQNHGGFASREKAKEAALLSAKNGNITLKDYTGTGITAPTTTPTFIGLNDVNDKNLNTQYKVSADLGNGYKDYTLVYGENGSYVLKDEHGTVYASDQLKKGTDVKVYSEQTRQYYDKAEGYQTLHDASTDGNKDARINGVGSHDRPDIHDEFMHHTHVTETVQSDFAEILLSEHPATSEMGGGTSLTKNEAILELMTTQQWTKQDAQKYIEDIASSGKVTFSTETPTKDKYFVGKYVTWHTELAGTDSKAKATQLRTEVENLKTDFETVKNQMEEWYGSAADSAKSAIGCILGKFIVTMGNIENALEPACEAMDQLYLWLDKMKTEDELLQKLLAEKQTLDSNIPKKEIIHSERVEDGVDSNGITKHKIEYITRPNPEFTTWQQNVKKKEEEITAKRKILDDIVLEVENYYLVITNYQQAIQQFSSFVSSDGSNHYMISSAENIVKYHDDIIYEFENFARMPVITNLTDYKVGDIVMFDDSYGTLYKVIEVFDENGKPTGYIKIIAVDENGNPLKGAVPITIWDQREIVPVGGKPTEKDPTENPDPPKDPDPTPPPKDPEPTPPEPTPPSREPEPTPPTPTPPPIEPEPTPVPPDYIPPHTGIDAVAGNSVVGTSAGLGSLAGLAMGAAGLGLTATMGNKEEEDEEEEEQKEKTIEQVKTAEEKKEASIPEEDSETIAEDKKEMINLNEINSAVVENTSSTQESSIIDNK